MPHRHRGKSRAGPALPGLALSLCLSAACTEPRFGTGTFDDAQVTSNECEHASCAAVDADAGDESADRIGDASGTDTRERDAAPRDASPTGDATTEDGKVAPPDAGPATAKWPEAMLGTYAVRVRFYSLDSLARFIPLAHELILLAHVQKDASNERVFMETMRCRDLGTHAGLVGIAADTYQWVYPERLPAERFELTYVNGRFHSEATPRTIGYVREQPAACSSADKAPKRADQAWIPGAECRCYPTQTVPCKIDDCRLTDPDADLQPGLQVSHTGAGGTQRVATEDSCQFIHGTLAPDGKHSANYVENYVFHELETSCTSSYVAPCPPETNHVEFAPLDPAGPSGSGWSCAALLAHLERASPFRNEMLTPRSGCQQAAAPDARPRAAETPLAP